MLNAFNLAEHYGLDKKDPLFYSYFLGEYTDNVSINKTEYESVELKVLDKDPIIACKMVDSLIAFYDKKIASMHRKKYKEVIDVSGNQLKIKSRELDSLETLLKGIRQTYGILDFNLQVTEVTKGELSGNNAAKELFKKLQDHGVEYQRLDSLVVTVRSEYMDNKFIIEEAMGEFKKTISYSQIVSSPYPADKKTYPIRWVIVAVTVITSLIFSLIIIAFIDSKQKKA
jgi:capsule polysaccharide export protein KpsE/RkpR